MKFKNSKNINVMLMKEKYIIIFRSNWKEKYISFKSS